ncbi:uncharacterized protein FA14DRAFT_81789 [Meira miltonrushii]|uniref:Uncharacterized protein n=1 Tax=Meira miltonrushii TaxID=1280837 RepID=A0A316V336_9BASI|nr:uncharacterized protein FA14DRAFT_81789 [Meira miltonrushii]PWN31872.1 hypothetical protein FA14DRAFT_81789 [Meira miltonrushii]
MDAAQDPPLRVILKNESRYISIEEAQRMMNRFVEEAKYNLVADKTDLSVSEHGQPESSTVRDTDPVVLSQIQKAADSIIESMKESTNGLITNGHSINRHSTNGHNTDSRITNVHSSDQYVSNGCGWEDTSQNVSNGCGWEEPTHDVSNGCGWEEPTHDVSNGCGWEESSQNVSNGCGWD